jgi:hypothetical protein
MGEMLKTPAIDFSQVGELLEAWLEKTVAPDAKNWLRERIDKTAKGDQKTLFLAFGMVPRKLGKADLNLSEADLKAAASARPGWNPRNWTVDQAARARLVLALASQPAEQFVETLDKLFASGEVGELVALYQALPVLPHQSVHALRASEGTRTNIKSVFCAVAHHNPYPAEQLEEGRWNQMVLKSLFIEAALHPIVGLDQRANPALARMLVDYAHERWAAGRAVSPELWRCVGPHADKAALKDLKRVLETGTPLEQAGAALALSSCPHSQAEEILETNRELAQKIQAAELTWAHLQRPEVGGQRPG